jgi:hypothetical protein
VLEICRTHVASFSGLIVNLFFKTFDRFGE